MLGLSIRFLTGRYVATAYNDRSATEWPPHPARLYSALADAHFGGGGDASERAALEWLAELGSPHLLCSDAARRTVHQVYVPVNDTSGIDTGWLDEEEQRLAAEQALADAEAEVGRAADAQAAVREVKRARRNLQNVETNLAKKLRKAIDDDGRESRAALEGSRRTLPAHRPRQPRTFPSCTPEVPEVCVVWPEAAPSPEAFMALDSLAARVPRLGHSSSLVSLRFFEEEEPRPEGLRSLVPSVDGNSILRVPDREQLPRLETEFLRHRGVASRILPCAFERYGDPTEAVAPMPSPVLGEDWIVFEVVPDKARGQRLLLQPTATEAVTRALRGAVLSHAEDPVAEALSGHLRDGTPSGAPHVAWVALPDVARRRSRRGRHAASGSILGVAVVLPRELEEEDRGAVLRAVGRWERASTDRTAPLRLPGGTELLLRRAVEGESDIATLRAGTWCSRARRWASVTAIALDRNPGNLESRDPRVVQKAASQAEKTIAASCEHIGLPRPAWVQVARRSLFDAAPPARSFMPFPRTKEATRRVCVHAELFFAEPVRGPLLLGAGRYFGIGLCRPRPEKAR